MLHQIAGTQSGKAAETGVRLTGRPPRGQRPAWRATSGGAARLNRLLQDAAPLSADRGRRQSRDRPTRAGRSVTCRAGAGGGGGGGDSETLDTWQTRFP